jgi:hypothetical protein
MDLLFTRNSVMIANNIFLNKIWKRNNVTMTTLLRRIKNAFEIFEIFEYIKQFLFEIKIFLLVGRCVNILE